MIVAIVPARGGSKRLPRKNILPFAGRPLLAWPILAATASPSVCAVWVSTDDDEIAQVAEAFDARVIRRPAALADDATPTIDVVSHALEEIRTAGHTVDAVLTLQPTNPLRPVWMIEDAVSRFLGSACDSLVSFSQRRLKIGQVCNGYFLPSYTFGQQSRLTEPITYENGLLYISTTSAIEKGSLCGERILAYITPRPFDEVDIDEAVDLVVGEAIAAAVRSQLGY
jgi:CMP-N-acetylneuraminic acid synthetase